MAYRFGVSTYVSPYQPLGLAYGDGTIWVATLGGGGVYRIDIVTGAIVANIATVGDAWDVVYAFGDAWVSHGSIPGFGRPSLSRIDPATNTITTTIAIGGDTYNLAADSSYVWLVAFNPTGRTYRIDPVTNTTAGFYADGGNLALGAGSVWLSQYLAKQIVRFDASALTLQATIATTNNPTYLDFAFNDLWITAENSGAGFPSTVERIDTSTNTVSASIAVTGKLPQVIQSDGSGMWVGDSTREFYRINPSTNVVVASITYTTAGTSLGMTVDSNGKMWASIAATTNTVNRFDLAGGIFTDGASHL
jgi:streptogramin lyase